MKKFFSLFAALLFAGSMFAAEYTFTALETPDEATADGLTFTFSKNSGSTNPTWNAGSGEARLYAKGSLTISSSSKKITKVVYNYVVNKNSKGKVPTIDGVAGATNAGTWTETTKTWEDATGDTEITLSTSGDAGNLGFKSITVTFAAPAEEIDATGISLDQNALTLTEGETATLKATLTPEGATTTVTWTSSNEKVATVSNGKVTAEGAGTATITAKAGELTATCDVTVNAAPTLTCAQANALANGANAKLGEFTVAYVNGANTYIKDASGYALIYKYDFGLKAGDVVTGFKGSMNIYNDLPELIPSVTLTDLTVTAGEAPAPEELADAPVAADVNKYVVLKGVSAKGTFTTSSKTTITVTFNEKSVAIYNNFKIAYEFDEAKSYDIVGAVAIYNGNVQVYFISATEQEEPVDPDQPSVTATPEEFEITAEGSEDNTVILEYTNLGETYEVEATADAEATWITNIALNDDNSELTFKVAANDGAARTATITVTATAGETVATATITVSQAAYVAPLTGDYFAKVTATADITDGAYLIVYEAENVAFNGALETLDAVGDTIAVEIADGKIAATEKTLAAVFSLAAVEGGYSVKAASGQYIGVSSYSNGLKQAETAYVHNAPTITEDGNAVLSISGGWAGDMILCFNADSGQKRFRYYKNGSQKAIQLYKLVKEQSPATAISNTAVETKAVKTLRNGILVIEKAGVRYNVMGQIIR